MRAFVTFPPKALPRMMSWTRGKVIDISIRVGSERISASRVRQSPTCGSWLHPWTRRHDEARAPSPVRRVTAVPCNRRKRHPASYSARSSTGSGRRRRRSPSPPTRSLSASHRKSSGDTPEPRDSTPVTAASFLELRLPIRLTLAKLDFNQHWSPARSISASEACPVRRAFRDR